MVEFTVWKDGVTSNDYAAMQRSIKLGEHRGKIPDEWNERMIAEYLKIFAEEVIRRETTNG